MPVILKKSFLFHYDPTINSDKVFNLFVIDNENGTYSTISEYGRSGTKLNVKPLIENCSLSMAQSRFSAKLNEKVYHKRRPYKHTLNASTSPTYQALGAETKSVIATGGQAKIIDFKPTQIPAQTENKSGEQQAESKNSKRSKRIGVLNLNALDALEI
jgi:hypothetical protein